ncbi:hypothetical protein RB597_004261 [Gaeumannomyces tritici]
MPAASSSQHPAPAPSSPALIPSSSPPAATLSSPPSLAHGHSHSHNSANTTTASASTSRSSRLLGLNSYLKKKSLTLTRDHNNHNHHSIDHANPAHPVVVRPRPQNDPTPTPQQTSPHHTHSQSAHPGQSGDATTTAATHNSNNNNSPADASTADAAPIHIIARRPVASLFRTVSSSSPNSRAVATATPSATSASGSPSIFPASWSRSRSTSPLSSQGPAPASALPSPDAALFPHAPSQSAPTLAAQPSAAAATPQPPQPLAHVPTSLESLAVVEPDRGIGAGPMTRTRAATASEASVLAQGGGPGSEAMPSIRFSTFYDPRATRPSLTFSPVSRTLPTGTEVIRVGRYSERDAQPNVPVNVPSAAPVGFKSKVVSRRHCEFWHEGGKWYIKDVKSSSGTFLNHIRLSPPGTESKPFPINDGDIVQLGIDFKGGEEMIFRCVKMRLELNRGWQSKLNAFNMNTHKRLRNMTKSGDGSASSQTSQDCSICLNSIAPCQCLFVAPCSHTWHYKCIRSLLASPQYPIFICPNCRAAADLEAEVEDPEEWEQMDSDLDESALAGHEANGEGTLTAAAADAIAMTSASAALPASAPAPAPPAVTVAETDVSVTPVPPSSTDTTTPSSPQTQPSHATSTPLPIPRMPSSASSRRLAAQGATSGVTLDADPSRSGSEERDTRTPSPTPHPPALLNAVEGPITPRNDAGPWVFDGSGVRMRAGPPTTAAASTTVAGAPGRNAAPQLTSLDDIARA